MIALASRVMAGALELSRGRFPRVVRIETTNHCNAACTFCPRDSIGRAKTFMEQDLFEKIIRQCAAGGVRTIHMHNFGEPLLDKRLPERIRFAKDQGIRRVKIITNGALLRGKMAEGLLASGVDEIRVSLDGANAEEFNKLRVGLDHAGVIENTRSFRRLRDELRPNGLPKIIGTCVLSSDKERTSELLKGVVDRVIWKSLHNWAGTRWLFGEQKVRKPCDRVWRTFTILVNGDVALCCLDHSGRTLLGNCRERTIGEIWNSEGYQAIRRLHRDSRQEEIAVCKGCTKSFY